MLLQPVLRALDSVENPQHVLVISSGDTLAAPLTRTLKGDVVSLTPAMVRMASYEALNRDWAFDLCVCILSFDDLLMFRDVLDTIRPQLRPGSKIVVFYRNAALVNFEVFVAELARRAFPIVGRSTICFSGSLPGAIAVRLFQRALERRNNLGPVGLLKLTLVLSASAVLARLAAKLERRRNLQTFPGHCTGLTIEITLENP
jgi:hypothetical protein